MIAAGYSMSPKARLTTKDADLPASSAGAQMNSSVKPLILPAFR